MPTMRQTGINPETHEKLCGTKRALSPSSSFVPIRTPSALLARDPHQLSSSLKVSLDSIKKLRSNVAECVVMDPFVGHGGRAAEIMDGVSTFCRNNATTNNNNNDGQEKNDSNDDDDDDRPPPMTVGAVTALDLYAQTLLTKRLYLNTNNKQHSPSLDYISSGSSALDQLLLPDTTYSSFEEGCNLSSSPFHIPTLDCYNHNNNLSSPTLNNNNHTSSSRKGGGIPYGQITELSGKTSSGKTQLALTITAHALLVNNVQVKYLIAGGGGGSSRMAISRRLSAICIGVAQLWKRRQQQQQGGERNQEIDGNNIMMMNIDKEAKLIASKCLERVTIATVHDAYSLLGSLVQIENEELSYRTINPHHRDDDNQGTLVVIDSISGCLGHHIYSDRTLGASLSNQVSMTLRQMTRSFDGHFDSGTTATSTDVLCQNPPRRFAVVVINGTVGKGANDNSGSELNNGMKTSSSSSSYKPAMGRYWHGGDMGLWLEENDDEDAGSGNGNSTAMSFYDGNVPGLSRSSEKVVTVTLQWHYGKSLGDVDGSARGEECGGQHQARFVIRAGGVADV